MLKYLNLLSVEFPWTASFLLLQGSQWQFLAPANTSSIFFSLIWFWAFNFCRSKVSPSNLFNFECLFVPSVNLMLGNFYVLTWKVCWDKHNFTEGDLHFIFLNLLCCSHFFAKLWNSQNKHNSNPQHLLRAVKVQKSAFKPWAIWFDLITFFSVE